VRTLIAARRILVLCVLVAAASTPLQALSPKVFVTPLGKDSLTCGALLTPCKTFAGAVAVVAPGGTVVVLTSGEYGAVTITKALTIQAEGVTALVQTAGTAVTVTAGPDDVVTLRGLALTSPTNRGAQGVLVNSAGAVHVERCTITNFIDAVLAFAWPSGKLFLTDSTTRNNDQGLRATTTGGGLGITIERCAFESGNVGIFVYDGTRTVIRESVASGNLLGLAAQANAGGSTELTVVDCLISHNESSGIEGDGVSGSVLVRVSGSTVTGNQRGLVQGSFGGASTFFSRGDNTVEGNLQGDLAGTIEPYSGK
jgi:hypothetical protein